MKILVRVFRIFLRVCVLVFGLLLPVTAAYDWFSPWQPAVKALAAAYPGQKRICVGFGSEKAVEVSKETGSEKSVKQRSFILVPSALTSPKIITIFENQDGKISKDESQFFFWFLSLMYLICLWGTWHFWIRPSLKKSK